MGRCLGTFADGCGVGVMADQRLASRLRDIADSHIGRDLAERLAFTDRIMRDKTAALMEAADEIDRLEARVKELEAHAATYPNTQAATPTYGTHEA